MTASVTMVRRPACGPSTAVERGGVLVMVMSSASSEPRLGTSEPARNSGAVSARPPFRAITDTSRRLAWHAAGMTAHRARAIAVSVVVVEVVLLAVGLVSDRLLVRDGRADLVSFRPESWVLILGVASAALVGVAIVRAQPGHPVGWLFLALSA